MSSVFISYATADSRTALRIYYDIKRSGATVYLYEKDGESGRSFPEEIHSAIDKSKYFCLIDSSNSRKSGWVRAECVYAYSVLRKGRGFPEKIIPCIVEEQGQWFHENELFSNQNTIRGIDFSGYDYLDYKEKYKESISKLIEQLEIEHRSWSELPRDRDFEKEISHFNLSDNLKTFLVRDYKNFVYSKQINSATSLNRILNLISDCSKYSVPIISCYLAWGAILAESYKDKEAIDVFYRCIKMFPTDARSWAALSASQFFLEQFDESLYSLNQALEIINANPENQYLQVHNTELLYNKIQLLISLKRFHEAKESLSNIRGETLTPEYLIASLQLSLSASFNSTDYKKLSSIYYDFRLNSKYLNSLIAHLEFQIARYYCNYNDLYNAKYHFEIAHAIEPHRLQYVAELLLVKKCLGEFIEDKIGEALKVAPVMKADNYFLGLVHYLNNNPSEAMKYYRLGEKFEWVFYDKLIEY